MVTTAVVCVVCSFTAGLLLGVLLTQCHVHCRRKQEKGQTEIPAMELKSNEAYGSISHSAIELQSNEAYGHNNT